MGGCCYAPSKREFLWWYWLLLASVVGIPMFLAAWYVARKESSEEEKRELGKKASIVFLVATVISFALAVTLGCCIAKHMDYLSLVGGFLIAVILANGAAKALRKNTTISGRIFPVLGHLLLWSLVCAIDAVFLGDMVGLDSGRPGVLPIYSLPAFFSVFAVCMLPAFCWSRFVDSPTTRNARQFLLGIVVGAFLFWAVTQL